MFFSKATELLNARAKLQTFWQKNPMVCYCDKKKKKKKKRSAEYCADWKSEWDDKNNSLPEAVSQTNNQILNTDTKTVLNIYTQNNFYHCKMPYHVCILTKQHWKRKTETLYWDLSSVEASVE